MKFYSSILISLFIYVIANWQDDLAQSMQRGKEVYEDFCITCHMAEGEGIPGVFPPVAKSDYLTKNRVGTIRSVKYGQQGEIEVNGVKYNGIMTPLYLEDDEVADVLNYVMNSWGNKEKMVTVEEVSGTEKE